MTKQSIIIIDIDRNVQITTLEVRFPIIAGEVLFIQADVKTKSIKIYQVMQVQKFFFVDGGENKMHAIVRNLSSQIITGGPKEIIGT